MKITENTFFDEELKKLKTEFNYYITMINPLLAECKSEVTTWKYSLGSSIELIPYEHLIPSVLAKKFRTIKSLTNASLSSKQLMQYGLNRFNRPILSIGRLDKNTTNFGELIRFVSNDIIMNCQVFQNNKHTDRLTSLTKIITQNNSTHYITISPPHDWVIRSDATNDKIILTSSIMATSWQKQLDYTFLYDSTENLKKILVDNQLHWANM